MMGFSNKLPTETGDDITVGLNKDFNIILRVAAKPEIVI